jgi:RNA polymerase sigma-70 factor, ECF subfamily
MGFEHFNKETISYAKRLIQFKSQQLVGRAGLSESDIEDLKQEMWADLLRRFSWFESDRAKAETFIDRVLSNCVAAILRHQCGASRNYRRNGQSLSSETEDIDGQTVELAQTLTEDVHDLRTGSVTRPALEQLELASDIQTVLGTMPAPLRELCQLLKTEQISVAASKLGITRHEANARLDQIREHFENAGLGDYL